MGHSRSTYYDRSERAGDDTAIVEATFAICDDFEAYGYCRVGAPLRQQGFVVNHKKIRRDARNMPYSARFASASSPRPTAITTVRSCRIWRGISLQPVLTTLICNILPHQVPNEHVENRHPKASTPEEAPPLTH
jgi:hypothetical protein